MGNGKWKMENGRWEMENGKWEMEVALRLRILGIHFPCFIIHNSTIIDGDKQYSERCCSCGRFTVFSTTARRRFPLSEPFRKIVRYLISLSVFRSLRHKNYRIFFFGQIVSLIGTWMQNIAQSWLVYQLTHSSVWLGVIGFLTSFPILLFSMFGGTLADRMPKKKVIAATQAASMVQAFILAGLVWTTWITPEIVGVLALTLGIINAFDMPSRQAFVVEMVGKEDLPNAIALNSAVFNGARIFGPAIGGIVIGAVGIAWCFFLNGISFVGVIAGLLVMNVVETRNPGSGSAGVFQSMKESIAYIRSDISLSALMILVAVLTVFGWSYSVLLPIFADTVLQTGAVGLGQLLTANGVGALISALTVAAVGHSVPPRTFVYVGLSIFVVSILMFAASSQPLFSLFCMVGVGMGLVAFFATANAALQRRAPDHLRGRVMGLYSLVFQGFFPFGSLGMGFLAKIVGVRLAVACGAIVCGVTGTTVYRVMKRKREK